MGRKGFPLPVSYFPTNLVYPFTLEVTGIKRANPIIEQLDYQESDTHLRMCKGDGDMLVGKQLLLRLPPSFT